MGTGFQVTKRPGLDKFLFDLSNKYEIVIFGDCEDISVINLFKYIYNIYLYQIVQDIKDKLDPYQVIINHALGKEATSWELGRTYKDLRYLNRNLANVVCIDFDPNSTKYTPDNTIIIPEFNGNNNDKELQLLTVFLKELSKPNVKDVRSIISKYGSVRTHISFYRNNPKYHKLVPKDTYLNDDEDIKAIRSSK